ncbi:MAG: hypothetical protein MMC23_006804 [Stictis urceolatum]|nr:hypothetical protein [Stictis urceolata]
MSCNYTTYMRPARRFPAFSQFPLGDFAPLFRLFDEDLTHATPAPIRSWQPRFDVREEKGQFHLQGELPGIDSKDVQIEFADENNMVIRGRSVRERTEGTKPEAGAVEAESESRKQIEQNEDGKSDAGSTSSSYKKPSVEDEFEHVEAEKPVETPTSSASEAAKEPEQTLAEKKPESKYWVSERSVGEFHRSFTFPGKVDQDAVTASLKDGILSVVVPKAVAKEPRRIFVQ